MSATKRKREEKEDSEDAIMRQNRASRHGMSRQDVDAGGGKRRKKKTATDASTSASLPRRCRRLVRDNLGVEHAFEVDELELVLELVEEKKVLRDRARGRL